MVAAAAAAAAVVGVMEGAVVALGLVVVGAAVAAVVVALAVAVVAAAVVAVIGVAVAGLAIGTSMTKLTIVRKQAPNMLRAQQSCTHPFKIAHERNPRTLGPKRHRFSNSSRCAGLAEGCAPGISSSKQEGIWGRKKEACPIPRTQRGGTRTCKNR